VNVSRVYRLLKLITLLRSERGADADSMADQLGISRRTLFRDLNLLEHAGVPYRFDKDKSRYAIADTFFLPPLHLDLEEAVALLLVTRKFLSRQVHPLYKKAAEAALKIESSLPRGVSSHCGHLLEGISVTWSPSSSADAINDAFKTVQRAVADRRKIQIRYDSVYEGRELDLLLEPRRVVFRPRGWYLIAYSSLHGEIRNFKIDRMLEVVLTGEQFTVDGEFDENEYFGAAWQMIPEGRLYTIKLRFAPKVAASVEEVSWHQSQSTTRDADGSLIFEATVDGLGEVSAWVLSYGGLVEVLAPAELRQLVVQKAQSVIDRARALDAANGNA